MIFAAAKSVGLEAGALSGRVLKVGDTRLDIEEGRNAGVATAAVLTGTQTRAYLEEARPDYVLSSVADLPTLFQAEALAPSGAQC
jgi:phosphoglycolate phosphatase-like HAD superfamily hydrolase